MISIIMQFIAGPVVGLFTENAKVIVLGSQYIRGYIFDCIFAGIHFSFSEFTFCACGHSELSFIHNIIAILLVRIPGVYITAKVFSSLFDGIGCSRRFPSFCNNLCDCLCMDEEKTNMY